MSAKTLIHWADTTANPTTGCDGCELWGKANRHCYAGRLHEGRLAKTLPTLYAADFHEVRLAPGRMAKAAALSDLRGTARPDKPWLDGMPRMIFPGDMADIFSKDVPFTYLKEELIDVATSSKGIRHIYMALTKRPSRMVEFAQWLHNWGWEWPANVWAGASVTTQKTVDNRIPHLLRVPDAVRFLSVEPMLGPIDLTPWLGWSGERMTAAWPMVWVAPRVDLVIFGGESGPDARPCDLAWIRDGVRQCKAAGVSAFVKQLGANPVDTTPPPPGSSSTNDFDRRIRLRDSHGGDWSEWPEDLRVREMPRVEESNA